MMEIPKIESELIAFLQREIFAPEVALTPESDLIGSGFDSMSLVRLLLFVENSYGLWLPAGEINRDTLQNVRTLSATVYRLLHAP
jgi:acyl carrier protein